MSPSPLDLNCVANASARIADGQFPGTGSRSRPQARWRRTASVLALAAMALTTSASIRQAVADGATGETGTFPATGTPISGGRGSDGTSGNPGDTGGIGMIATGATGPNTADITGGAGGNSVFSTGRAGSGGAGGVGVSYTGAAALTNQGTITGGAGGRGGQGMVSNGDGGVGGAGLSISTSGVSLTNTGAIRGGDGGLAGDFYGTGGTMGVGGVGVIGAGLTIDNRGGTISGGLAGDAVTRANAIIFTGGANTLTLSGNGGLTGNVAIDAGTLAFNQSTAVTLDNVITGNGGIIQNGTGTLTLTGANIYSGGTTITSGTLQIGAGGTTGSIANNVVNNATLAFKRSDNLFVSGVISGTGAVQQLGTGTTIITGTNTYTGGTTISAGTLQIGWGNTSGMITGDVVNNATLRFNRTDDVTFAGAISGTGDVEQWQASILTLTGASTYSGRTTVSGTLAQGAANAFSANSFYWISTGKTLDLGVGAATIGSLGGDGQVLLRSYALTTGADNSSSTFDGALTGTGSLRKTGSGNFTLSKTSTSTYTGATTIDGGTLSVNGDITASSGVTVNAGGTLGGNGTVGTTTINGGTLAPGNSIGTLTVQGNLSFTAASTYLVEVAPNNVDRVNVTGTATLGGATVKANFAPATYVEKQYTILNAQGGVSGKFSGPVNTNLPTNFKSSLSTDSNNAYLNLTLDFTPTPDPTPNPTPGGNAPSFGSLPGNQGSVANALTGFFNRTGGIPLVFGALDAKGLSQVSGELAPGSQQTSFDVANIFMMQMTDPFAAGRGDAAPGAMPYADEAMAYAAPKRAPTDAFASMHRKAPMLAPQERWNVWAAGFGGSQTTDGNAVAGTNNSKSSIYGMAVGADYWFSPFTVAGLSMAGGGTNFSVNGGGSGRSDLFQVGGFVRHMMGSVYVSAAAAYGWQDVTTDRVVTVAGFDQLRANFNANSYSGRVEIGNRFVTPWIGGFGLTPYGAVQVTALDLPSYAESVVAGANTFALAYSGKTITATRSELGFRTDKSFAVNDAILTLRGRAAWAHDYNPDRSASATFQSLPGASFIVNGASLAKHTALTSASAELKWMNGWSIAGTFEGEFSDVTRSYAGKGVVRYAW